MSPLSALDSREGRGLLSGVGAARHGVGAFLVDGRMIDIPSIERAEAILGAARRLGRAG